MKSYPGEVFNACVKVAYVRIVAHWTAVVLNERKQEGDHTLTPAGCG